MFDHHERAEDELMLAPESAAPAHIDPPSPVPEIEREPGFDQGQSLGGSSPGLMTDLWLDPLGVADRVKARQELADRFEIVDDDHEGRRAPNQVTQSELDQIARTYSDIRLGRSDLEIDASGAADPDQFKGDMMADIADILQTKSGRDLVGELADNVRVDDDGDEVHRTTTLSPRLDESGAPDYSDATAGGDLDTGTRRADGRPGAGSDAEVEINPRHDVALDSGGVLRSDVALYHELAHARTYTRGTLDGSAVQPTDNAVREAAQLDFGEMAGELLNPDPGLAHDARGGGRHEHQAIGLGLYADQPVSENAYRRERRLVGQTGRGRRGDRWMRRRDRALDYRDDYRKP